MEFADILEQTIALLQHQGRLSYGALKRRFGLDDAYLEDLKIELIEAQQLARDETGRILVWVGPSAPASPPVVEPALSPALAVPQGEFPRGESHTPEAERRQLTVLFCDLVDSTALAAHRAMGMTLFCLGEFARARVSLEQGIALYTPERHHTLAALHGEDLGVACLSCMAWALGWLGYAEQARQRLHEARTLVQELRYPYGLSRPLLTAAILHQLWGEGPATQEHAEAIITSLRAVGASLRLVHRGL